MLKPTMANQQHTPKLPETWVLTTLSDVADVASGGTPSTKRQDYFDGEIPWITPADLSGYSKKYISRGKRNITEKGLRESSAILLPKDTVIFSSRAPIGYVAIAANPLATNQGFKNFVPSRYVSSEYLYHYLKSAKKMAQRYASGTTFLEISARRAATLPIPIPPLPEQHRIVAKIEELFSRLDASSKSLDRVQAQLKHYRRSALKRAFSGKLTEKLGITQGDRDQSYPHIRKREGQPEVTESDNKPSILNARRKLGTLPDDWKWVRLGDVCKTASGGTPSRKHKEYFGGSIPWLKSGELNNDLICSAEEMITVEGLKNSSAKIIQPGALLIALYGATVGKLGILTIEAAINQAICAVITSDAVSPKFLFLFMILHRPDFLSARRGGAQPNISQQLIKDTFIPLPPKSEQNWIVEEIESRFLVADQAEQAALYSVQQSKRLRQSILKRAFGGNLVPQNPRDQPADLALAQPRTTLMSQKKNPRNQQRQSVKQMELRHFAK